MGKIKDFLSNIGFDDNERYEEEEMYEEEDVVEEEEVQEEPARAPRNTRPAAPAHESAPAYRKAGSIETIKPATYSDAHKIVEKLREGNIIVFSLELVDDELAVRILDFVYGGTFALDGKIKEVGTRVYVVTNAGINLSEIAGDSQQKNPNYK